MQRFKETPLYLWWIRHGFNKRVSDVITPVHNSKRDKNVLTDFAKSSTLNFKNCSNSKEQMSPANDEGITDSQKSKELSTDDQKGVIKESVPSDVKIVNAGALTTASTRIKKIQHLILISVVFRIFGILLVFVDVSFLIVEIFVTGHDIYNSFGFCSISLVISLFFLVDVLFRLHVEGSQSYFSDSLNILDTVIIGMILFSALSYKAYEMKFLSHFPRLEVLSQPLRFVVIARLFQLVYQKKHLEKLIRRLVAGNKRRYINQQFDLDLTYVTENIIAMSFPSSGRHSFYRNPIQEVVRFLDTSHPDHYRVYNLCSERAYNPKYFHNRVQRIMIDDHNVPTLKEMLLFCKEVNAWLTQHSHNVIAIHCKGGKGRTGTMVCACLMANKVVLNAQESLCFFGDRRTDLTSSSKYQGIETPSQDRYVTYFEQVAHFYQWTLPPRKVLVIKKIILYSIHGIGKGNGSDLRVHIICQKAIFSCCYSKNCMIFHDIETDTVIINLYKCPALYDDVKVKFFCPGLPKYYDNCPFFFWFHTSFVRNNRNLAIKPACPECPDEAVRRFTNTSRCACYHSLRLYLQRNKLDNLHKPKTWKIYGPEFAVEVCFDETHLFVH